MPTASVSKGDWPASKPRAVRFDGGRHDRAKLGFVLLAMDQTSEDDVRGVVPDDIGVHFSRVTMANSVTVETLAAMLPHLSTSASLIVPNGTLDAVTLSCTSGSIVIGEENVCAALAMQQPQARTTTLVTGVVRGLKALGARKIVVGTPYLDEINRIEADYLLEQGFEVLDIQGLNVEMDEDMSRIEPEYLRDFALELDRADADAIFISCSALRTLDAIEEIEQRAGKPAVCSNQAMIWDVMRLAGIDDRIEGYGRLLREH